MMIISDTGGCLDGWMGQHNLRAFKLPGISPNMSFGKTLIKNVLFFVFILLLITDQKSHVTLLIKHQKIHSQIRLVQSRLVYSKANAD